MKVIHNCIILIVLKLIHVNKKNLGETIVVGIVLTYGSSHNACLFIDEIIDSILQSKDFNTGIWI